MFEAFPAEGFGGFAAEAELGVFFVGGLFDDDEDFVEPGGSLGGDVNVRNARHGEQDGEERSMLYISAGGIFTARTRTFFRPRYFQCVLISSYCRETTTGNLRDIWILSSRAYSRYVLKK